MNDWLIVALNNGGQNMSEKFRQIRVKATDAATAVGAAGVYPLSDIIMVKMLIKGYNIAGEEAGTW